MKKTHADQRIYKFFCCVWKERTHKLSEETAAKIFCSVYVIDTTCFDGFFCSTWGLDAIDIMRTRYYEDYKWWLEAIVKVLM